MGLSKNGEGGKGFGRRDLFTFKKRILVIGLVAHEAFFSRFYFRVAVHLAQCVVGPREKVGCVLACCETCVWFGYEIWA